MITIQHQETEKNGVFEAWMRATEEGACTEPVQIGEMTYQRPTSQRMIIDHTALPGRWFLLLWTLHALTADSSSLFVPTPVPFSPAQTNTKTSLYKGELIV